MFRHQNIQNSILTVTVRVAVVVCGLFAAHSARATEKGTVESAILFNCNVSFTATGRSAYIVIGSTNIEGTGTMTCYDFVKNVIEDIPLKVRIRGPGIGLGVTGLNISGGQRGIGLSASPDSLLGDYLVLRGNAAIGVGGAASTGIRIAKGSVQLTAQVEGTSGLGAGLDLLTFTLERDNDRPATSTAAVQAPAAVAQAPQEIVRVRMNQVVEVVDASGRSIGRYQFVTK